MPMRQLRSCDFCGGDAAGVYEILPPELSPTDAEQRRVVLCADCTETLETVVGPLLERLGVETGDGAPAVDTGGDPDGQSAATGVSVANEPGTDAGSEDPDRPPTDESASGTGSDDGRVQWGESGPVGDDESGDPERSASDPAHVEGLGIGPSDDDGRLDGADPAGAEPQTATPEPVTGGADAPDSGGTDGDAAASGAGAAGDDDPTPGDEPEEFRTVMRLLGNREFPVERDAIAELAASAYELDEQHVHRIIDHAVDRGVIVDDDGLLRRE